MAEDWNTTPPAYCSRTSLSGHSGKWTHSLDSADKVLVTDWKSHTCNTLATSEKRPPLNSEQWTLSLVPKHFCNIFLPPNSGHSGNHTLTLQPLPHLYLHACNSATPICHIPCARVQITPTFVDLVYPWKSTSPDVFRESITSLWFIYNVLPSHTE